MQITSKQAIEMFEKEHHPGQPYRKFSRADENRLKDRLPDVVLHLAKKHGWCSFGDQRFWLCDPDEWADVPEPWLGKKADLFLRSSFGDFLATTKSQLWIVLPHSSTRIRASDDPNWVFGVTLTRMAYDDLANLTLETDKARRSAGALEWREIYNFAPAVALGGSREDAAISREDMAVALQILSQVAPITALDD